MIRPSKYTATLQERNWLSEGTFELICGRPTAFDFSPGQKIRIGGGEMAREYSIASSPGEVTLRLCIRHIKDGLISSKLSRLAVGSDLSFIGPYGYFNFKPSSHQAVFVATGTGIAPFAAMVRAGIRDFILLHGVQNSTELYYRTELESAAFSYTACISTDAVSPPDSIAGRVTDYLKSELQSGIYDFYLCGGGEMIRDVILLIDDRFEGSRVFTEKFY